MAGIQGCGRVPSPRGGLVVAVVGAGAMAGWAATMGVVSRQSEEVVAAEKESLEALKEQVVTTVSHELRTPLTIIQGLTSGSATDQGGWVAGRFGLPLAGGAVALYVAAYRVAHP